MIMKKLAILMVALTWGAAAPVFAGHATLSGLFDGSEPVLAPLGGNCANGGDELGYVVFSSLLVSQSGVYDIVDAGDELAVDVVVTVYKSSFNPADPGANVLAAGFNQAEQISLEQGTAYAVVIQHQCSNRAGAYGVAISGPGTVSGPGVVASPSYTLGEFTPMDPTADFGFATTVYNVNGPIQVQQTGTYYFADLSVYQRVDMLLYLYNQPFNPDDPGENAIAVLDDSGTVELEAGVDYYLVSVPWETGEPGEGGEWHYALFPPGTPAFNSFFSGAYFEVDGQGILMEVFPQIRLVFLAWFAFEQQDMGAMQNSLSGGPMSQALGGTRQRWFTATGSFVPRASSVELTFQNTTGGAFNMPGYDRDTNYGSGALHVDDCNNVTLEFDLPSGPVSGMSAMTRVGIDDITEAGCLEVGSQPGMIE
jgi:hypothetical protein